MKSTLGHFSPTLLAQPPTSLLMNYLAHGYRFTDDPYFLAGTAVPDWLSVVDRKVRVRSKFAAQFTADGNPQAAAVARGIVQHHADDAWFHQTRAFAELSWKFTVEIRDCLNGTPGSRDDGFRPSFLGHILVELLLDCVLTEESPDRLTRYYDAMQQVDPAVVQATVNQITARPADRLGEFIDLFRQHQFLFDYTDDDKLLFRVNQVMRRVKLSALPDSLTELFPQFRAAVLGRRKELLAHP